MKLETTVEYIEILLNLILVIRLFSLRLGKVYAIFTAYLLADLLGSLAASSDDLHLLPVDYRTLYIGTRIVAWILSLWVIYALLNAMLRALPGILRYSKRLLHGAFAAAFLIAISVLALDNALSSAQDLKGALDRLVLITYVVDQTIAITILLVLVVMLGFFLWFPVVVARNLAVFSIGYVVYFSCITASLLLQGFHEFANWPIISIVLMLITSICYAYWAIFLSKQGEVVPVHIGHSWQADEQRRLMLRLEEVNGVLLQTLANKKAV